MNRLRALIASLALLGLAGCSSGGVNAGEQGGEAFIGFTVMLIIGGVLLWLALGRED